MLQQRSLSHWLCFCACELVPTVLPLCTWGARTRGKDLAQDLIANPQQNKTPTNISGIQLPSYRLHVIPKNPLPEGSGLQSPALPWQLLITAFIGSPDKYRVSLLPFLTNVNRVWTWVHAQIGCTSSILRDSDEAKGRSNLPTWATR